MNYLGEEGYLAIADVVMKTATKIREGIAAIGGLKVLGNPEMRVLAIGSERLNITKLVMR